MPAMKHFQSSSKHKCSPDGLTVWRRTLSKFPIWAGHHLALPETQSLLASVETWRRPRIGRTVELSSSCSHLFADRFYVYSGQYLRSAGPFEPVLGPEVWRCHEPFVAAFIFWAACCHGVLHGCFCATSADLATSSGQVRCCESVFACRSARNRGIPRSGDQRVSSPEPELGADRGPAEPFPWRAFAQHLWRRVVGRD